MLTVEWCGARLLSGDIFTLGRRGTLRTGATRLRVSEEGVRLNELLTAFVELESGDSVKKTAGDAEPVKIKLDTLSRIK